MILHLWEGFVAALMLAAYGWEISRFVKARRARKTSDVQAATSEAPCFLTARGALAQDIQDGQVIALAVLCYEPADDRLFIIALAGRTNPEVTGLLAKFNIHAGESELSR